MSATHTLPSKNAAKKQTLSLKDFHQGKHKEPTMNENTEKEMLPAQQQEQAKTLLPISINTYVASLTNAMISSRYALQLELSVGLSVFFERGSADREAKKLLYSIYHKAGWKCDTPEAENYKTVNRRINSSAALFTTLGAERIGEMIGGNAEIQAINALVKGIEPLQLNSVDGVLAYCGKPRLPAAKAAPQQIEGEQPKQQEDKQDNTPKGGEGPSGGTPSEGKPKGVAEETKADEGKSLEPGEIILDEPKSKAEAHADKELPDDVEGPRWMRRVEDNPDNIFKRVDTLHIHIALTKDADRTEIIAAAMKLLSIAEEMNNGHEGEIEVKGALQEELSKLEQTPLKAELRNVPEPMPEPRGRRVIR